MEGQSRYAQKGPPHQYSEQYRAWKAAALRRDDKEMGAAAHRWARCWGR